jgi:stress-induced morphogen
MGPIEHQISERLKSALHPTHFELINESHMHGRPSGTESHFKVLIVSDVFQGLSRIDRQRKVNSTVSDLLANAVHAFTQKTLTPTEWEAQKGTLDFQSPECAHGVKR